MVEFIEVGDYVINITRVTHVHVSSNGSIAVNIAGLDKPIRFDGKQAKSILDLLLRRRASGDRTPVATISA